MINPHPIEPEGLGVRYSFEFSDGSSEVILVELDERTLALRSPLPAEPPPWTALEFEQCPHCPLDPEESPRCPAALALAPLVKAFDHVMSHDRCRLEVTTAERTVVEEDVAIQKALGSLMGLIMAASGCPYTSLLRPMARYHLPLASTEETIYRATSMYLLAQYFLYLEGEESDWEMEGLAALYDDLRVINRQLSERLSQVVATDSSVNAVIGLDVFAAFLPLAIQTSLAQLRPYFQAWTGSDIGG